MEPTGEHRVFTMHHNLLRDVIERQAGSIDKAVLEGVMNLIEARATVGDVTLSEKRLVIADDGAGFATREEILAAFEVFGKSDERKAEKKQFAKFQMGRGQLFAFGKTTYRTRTFEMIVDIRDPDIGLGYRLRENLPDQPGCIVTVQLYEPLSIYDMKGIGSDIRTNVKYVDIPIRLNGDRLNEDPQKIKWSQETEDAYFLFREHSTMLEIYNLGVFVCRKVSPGTGGIIVSKKQLDVNFARNDILTSCPVWKAIQKNIRSTTEKALTDKKRFTLDDAREVVNLMQAGGRDSYHYPHLAIFRSTTDKRISLSSLSLYADGIAFDEAGSQRADKVMQTQRVCVLNASFCQNLFDTKTPEQTYKSIVALWKSSSGSSRTFPPLKSLDALYAGIAEDHTILKDSTLSDIEKLALGVLRRAFSPNYGRIYVRTEEPIQSRRILIGKSDTARAWTNGSTYIVIDRDVFRKAIKTLTGWNTLVWLMAHEYAHESAERTHDGDFYERAHDYFEYFGPKLGQMYREFAKRIARSSSIGTNVQDLTSFTSAIRTIEGPFLDEPLDEAAEFAPESEVIEAAVA